MITRRLYAKLVMLSLGKYGFDKCSSNAIRFPRVDYTEHDNDTLTDDMGLLTNFQLENREVVIMMPMPTDAEGRPDFRTIVSLDVTVRGLRLVNMHFTTNWNGWIFEVEMQNAVFTRAWRVVGGARSVLLGMRNVLFWTRNVLFEHKMRCLDAKYIVLGVEN